MRDFSFQRPTTIAEAVAALRASPEDKLLAGGQSLLPMMKFDLALPTGLVSLADVAELGGVRREGDTLVVGAGMTHAAVASSPEVSEAIPALAQLAHWIGDAQVRNRGTLGGSVAHADPGADYPAAVVGLGATLRTDRRELAADDFFRGPYETALLADEVLTEVAFPVPECAAYEKFPHPASRFAVVGVFVASFAGSVRVAVTGAATRAFRYTALEEALAGGLSEAAAAAAAPPDEALLDDSDASAAYRRHLIGVLARRAVARCA